MRGSATACLASRSGVPWMHMKKSLIVGGLFGLVLLGFGCSRGADVAPVTVTVGEDGTVNKPVEAVEGSWYLAFDIPDDWVIVPHYNEGFDKAPTAALVTSDMSDIVVQSTEKIIALTGSSELPEGTFITDDYTFIRVFRMEKRSLIPGEAEDIGNGFFKLEKGVNATYYYEGTGSNYKFIVYRDGQDLGVAEDVITSAKEVTSFTGTTTE